MKADEPIRKSSFRLPGQGLFYGKARLYADHLALHGMGWKGWYSRRIALSSVVRVEWWSTERKEMNLGLHLEDGTLVGLYVPGPGLWKYALDARLEPTVRPEERAPKPLVPAA